VPLRIILVSNAPFVNSGYGVTTANLAKMWKQMGHEVAIFSIYGLEGAILTWEGMTVFGRSHSQWGQDSIWSHCQKFGADVVISNADTHFLGGYGNGPVPWVPICPVMEDPLIPMTKSSMDGAYAIVTISQYSRDVLKAGGLNSRCIPLPVATDFYYPIPKQGARELLGIAPGEFAIGNVGMNRGRRKGHDILLQAFRQFLGEVPRAKLLIHTNPAQPDGLNLEGLVQEMSLTGKVSFPSPYDAFYGVPASHMLAFYNALDLSVYPSLNEGLCLPLWEGFACGNVAVATDATALREAMVGAQGVVVEPHRTRNLAQAWSYEVTPEALCEAMLKAYEVWGRGKETVSLQNRQWAIDNVSVPIVGFLWQEFLWELEKRVRFAPAAKPWKDKPTIAHVATRVQNCGIAAYTRSLQASMEVATVDVPAPDIRSIVSIDDIPDTAIVHWQHEPAISPPASALNGILRDLKLRNQTVMVTYHNVDPGLIAHHLNSNVVDAAIVHWPVPNLPKDKRLHVLGGMGCPTFHPPRSDMRADIRAEFGFDEHDIIVSTFGFASVGRGHSEVLLEMATFLQQSPIVKFLLIVPQNFLNQQGYDMVRDQIVAVATAYGIADQVHLIDQYMPDSTVLRALWMSDVGYLYLPIHTASSSSAVRFFISARLPTVVTPSTHFADVRFGVVRTETFMLAEFCQAIGSLIQDPARRERLRKEHDITYESSRWPVFGEKMMAIYKSAMEGK
jgi:glycosyltransferase involved in cell wall biosynthesis